MASRMIGPALKLGRAKQHLADLDRYHAWYLRDPHPYKAIREVQVDEADPIRSVATYRFRMIKPIPAQWSVMAGDILHNLRSALDLLACQLVEANDGTVTDRTEFPIGRSQTAWETGGSGRAILKSIDPDAMTVLCALKPYQGGNDAFWAVHRLNITDKHNLLVPICTAPVATILGTGPEHANLGIFGEGRPPEAVEEGATILALPLDFDKQVKAYFDFEVAFREAPVAAKPFLGTLQTLTSEVEAALKAFLPFL